MYNRYIPMDDTPAHSPEPEPCHTAPEKACGTNGAPPPPRSSAVPPDGLTGLLRHFLDQFHLNQVDSGDLLLLALLFFLFRENADEELLVALGLLLIL